MRTSVDECPVTVATEDRGPDRLVTILRKVVVGIIGDETPDLSMQQLGALFICCLGACSARGLLDRLRGSRRGMNRALARLEKYGLVRLECDASAPADPMVRITARGRAFLACVLAPACQAGAAEIAASPERQRTAGSDDPLGPGPPCQT